MKSKKTYFTMFYIITSLYSLGYLLMVFFPVFHKHHAIYLILGLALIISFVMVRSFRTLKNKYLKIGLIVMMAFFVTQVILEFSHIAIFSEEHTVFHFTYHLAFSLTYLLTASLLLFQVQKFQKDNFINNSVFNLSEVIVFDYDAQNELFYVNVSKLMQLKYGLEKNYAFSKTSFNDLIHPEDKAFLALIDQIDKINHSSFDMEFHIRFNENMPFITMMKVGLYVYKTTTVFIGHDYTDFKELEKKMSLSQDTHLKLIRNIPVSFVDLKLIFDKTGKPVDYEYLYVNDAYLKDFNIKLEDYLHQKGSIKTPTQYSELLNHFYQAYKEDRLVNFKFFVEKNQKWYSISAYKTKQNSVVVLLHSIDDLVNANKQLEYTLTHNSRNDLLNLEGVYRNINQIGKYDDVKLFFITLYDYHDIKSYYGLTYSNKIVDQIAKNISSSIKNKDIIALVEENKYIVVLFNPAKDYFDKVYKLLSENIYKEYNVLDVSFHAKLNIGYADKNQLGYKEDLSELINLGSIASIEASRETKNVIYHYDEKLSIALTRRVELANKLAEAIEKDEIEIYFQKIKNVKTNRVAFLEALSRWSDKELGPISPEKMLNIAKLSNMSERLNYYLVNKTLKVFKELDKRDVLDTRLSLNLDPFFFKYQDAINYLINITNHYSIDYDQICLEISENTFVSNIESIISIINELKDKGFIIAIDDFGSKYSSLGVLEQINYDVLKIDGVFVNKVHSKLFRSFLQTLILTHHEINKYIVIEKIETLEEADAFKELGCNLQQGYYHHKPEKFI